MGIATPHPAGFAEQRAGDHEPLDLARALVDLGDLRVAVVALGGELLRVAVAAEDLDRLAGLAARDGAREQLRLRALDRVRLAGLLEPAARQSARGRLDLRLHVGELLLDRAEPRDRAAERGALLGVAVAMSSAACAMPTAWAAIPIRPPSSVRQRDPHALARLAEPLGRRVLEREVGGRGGVQAHLLLLARDREAVGAARTTNALMRSPSRAKTRNVEACEPLVIHCLAPVMRRRRARVRIALASEPEPPR
jgi:hypothetical protein